MAAPCLTLSAQHRNQLLAAARVAHPEECCGVLLGRSSDVAETIVEQVVPAPNVSPVDRRREYVIDPEALLAAWHQARAEGWAVVGFYHSHPDGSHRPSRRDREDAWPDVSYLIVPSHGEMASWRRGSGGDFTSETLVEAKSTDGLS